MLTAYHVNNTYLCIYFFICFIFCGTHWQKKQFQSCSSVAIQHMSTWFRHITVFPVNTYGCHYLKLTNGFCASVSFSFRVCEGAKSLFNSSDSVCLTSPPKASATSFVASVRDFSAKKKNSKLRTVVTPYEAHHLWTQKINYLTALVVCDHLSRWGLDGIKFNPSPTFPLLKRRGGTLFLFKHSYFVS